MTKDPLDPIQSNVVPLSRRPRKKASLNLDVTVLSKNDRCVLSAVASATTKRDFYGVVGLTGLSVLDTARALERLRRERLVDEGPDGAAILTADGQHVWAVFR